MLTRNDYILHTGVLCQLHPLVGIEINGIEDIRKLRVLLDRYLKLMHSPLTDMSDPLGSPFTLKDTVQTEVDHHSHFRLLEPFFIFFQRYHKKSPVPLISLT